MATLEEAEIDRLQAWIERLQESNRAKDAEIERMQELLSDTEAERERLKAAMRINAIIWNPRLSHDEINSEIERIMRGVLPVGQFTEKVG